MPDSLDSVRVLYNEPRPDGTMPPSESLSGAARAEVAALAPLKAALDARPCSTPDAATVAAVLEAAHATAASSTPRAADRPPARAPRRSRFRVAIPILAACVCVAVGLAVIAQQGAPLADAERLSSEPIAAATPPADEAVSAAPVTATPTVETPIAPTAPAPVPDEGAVTVAPTGPADQAPAESGEASSAAADIAGQPTPTAAPAVSRALVSSQPGLRLASTASSAAVTAWDNPTDEDLRLLSLRLQTLRESNQGLAWDEPPVALSVPAGETLRARDIVSDTAHDETRVGFHAVPPSRTGFIRVQPRGQ